MSAPDPTRQLPAEFADLQPFVETWALPSEALRYARREASSMQEIQRFYDAMLPRAEAALAWLDQFPLDAMPQPAKVLMQLLESLATISFCVEVWKQPRVWETGSAKILSINEPVPV